MPVLEISDLTLGYGEHTVLRDVRLAVCPGRVLALAGPNGAGKTTLLRALARLLRPQQGAVLLDGQDIWSLSHRETAQRLGLVPQGEPLDWPLSVEQVVSLGRAAHRGWFLPLNAHDRQAVDDALAHTGLVDLRARLVVELSGGERQRVLIARALAQQPRALLLDEPTAHLDLRYQGAVLGLIRDLAHRQGLMVVVSLHDLNLVALYADQVALVAAGGLMAVGSVDSVLVSAHLERAYGAPVVISRHPVYGTPLVTPVVEPLPPRLPTVTEVDSGGRPADRLLVNDARPAGLPVPAPEASRITPGIAVQWRFSEVEEVDHHARDNSTTAPAAQPKGPRDRQYGRR